MELVKEPGFENQFVQEGLGLVVKFIDISSQFYKIGEFEDELATLKAMQAKQVKSVPQLMDWGTYKDNYKFIVTMAKGENIANIFKDSKNRFRKIDVLKIGI